MTKSIPYNAMKKNIRAYEMMLLRDQNGSTYGEIARLYGVSATRVNQLYHGMKARQMRLYAGHVAFVLGHEDDAQMQRVCRDVHECYWDWACVCAYLEKVYGDILNEYRNGEPGMPAWFVEGLPPYRADFDAGTIDRVIRMKEEAGASFAVIAGALGMTRAKAARVYDWYYHEKVLALIAMLGERGILARGGQDMAAYFYREYRTAKKRYEAIVRLYPGVDG